MQTKVLLEKVNAMCREPVAHRGLTLWDVTFEKEGPRYLLTVVVDKESGVDIDDCRICQPGHRPSAGWRRNIAACPLYPLRLLRRHGAGRCAGRNTSSGLWAAGWSFLFISPMTARKPRWAFWKTTTAIP